MDIALKVPKVVYGLRAKNAKGDVLWEESFKNLVTTEGMNELLSQFFKGAAYTASWFVGLKGTGTGAIGDTAASHAGWSEVTTYSESVRQTLTLGAVAAASVGNSAAPATFSINGNATIAGAFIANSSTKGGTGGVLYSVGDFSSSRTLANGDTLEVTVTLSAA